MSIDDAGRDVEGPVREAKSSLVQRHYDRADEIATSAIKLDPRNAPAYLVRAEARRKLGRPDQALADLAASIRLDPSRAPAYVVRAEILKKRCLFDQAVAEATFALTLNPENAAAYSIRAECRRAIGDLDGAAEDDQELVRIDPTRHAVPFSPPSPATCGEDQVNESSRGRTGRAYDDIFADDRPVDRSLKTKVLMDADEAAELLAMASGYRHGIVQFDRPARSKGSKAQPGPIAFLVIAGGLGLFGFGYFSGSKEKQPTQQRQPVAAIDRARSESVATEAEATPAANRQNSSASGRQDKSRGEPIGSEPVQLGAGKDLAVEVAEAGVGNKKRVIELEGKLIGAWRLISAEYGNANSNLPEGTWKVKYITPGKFEWVTYGEGGKVIKSLGGSYSLSDNRYEEIVEYGTKVNVEAFKKNVWSYNCKVEGNRWYCKAKRDDGLTNEEVWERIENGKQPEESPRPGNRPGAN